MSSSSSFIVSRRLIKTIKKLDNCLNKIILSNSIANNNCNDNKYSYENLFKAQKLPSISIINFICKLVKYANIENNTLIVSLIILDRFLNATKTSLTQENVYILTLISIVISCKYLQDVILDDTSFAVLGSMNVKSFSLYEGAFLSALNYNIYVSQLEFSNYNSLF